MIAHFIILARDFAGMHGKEKGAVNDKKKVTKPSFNY